ncbi:MAG TPA: hypothetical protein VN748_10865 [Pseudonocardiaceae bacterium]|nr:hypothetical protein [Pseudonocardiaceae bacterium]
MTQARVPRARQLAEELVAAGKVWLAHWWEAICAVPRHEFVAQLPPPAP